MAWGETALSKNGNLKKQVNWPRRWSKNDKTFVTDNRSDKISEF